MNGIINPNFQSVNQKNVMKYKRVKEIVCLFMLGKLILERAEV